MPPSDLSTWSPTPTRVSRFRPGDAPAPVLLDAAVPSTGRGWQWVVLLPVSAYVLALAALLRDCFMDDAYIGFRCVENLLAGKGFAFNPGQYVEAVTNIGWLIFLSPLALVLPVPLAAKAAGVLLLLATAALAGRLAQHLAQPPSDRLFVWLAPVLVVTHPDLLLFSLSGMETALLAAGILWLALRAGHHGRAGRPAQRATLTALSAAVLFLVHPEAVLVYPLAQVLLNGGDAAAWRRSLRPAAVFVTTIALATLARWLYFGSPLPNTFYAKATVPSAVGEQLLAALTGENANISYPFAGLLAVPFVLGGLAAVWREQRATAAWLAAATLTGTLFCIYSAADWTALGRYFAPYAPAALLLFWRGFLDLNRRWLGLLRPPAATAALGALAGLLVFVSVLRTLAPLDLRRTRAYPGYVLTSTTLVEPALWLRDALPDDAVIASRRLGALGYYSQKHVFDYTFGLPEPEVARLVQQAGEQFHNPRAPALRELWRGREPGYLLEDRAVIDALIADARGTPDAFDIHGLTYRVRRAFPIGDGVDWVLCERCRAD